MNQKTCNELICVHCFLSKAKVLIINYDVKIIITKKTPIPYMYVHIYIGSFNTKISFLEKNLLTNLVSVFCQLQHIPIHLYYFLPSKIATSCHTCVNYHTVKDHTSSCTQSISSQMIMTPTISKIELKVKRD